MVTSLRTQYLSFEYFRVLYYIEFRSKSLRKTKQTLQKATFMSILPFVVANILVLYDREPHVDDLGKDGGATESTHQEVCVVYIE